MVESIDEIPAERSDPVGAGRPWGRTIAVGFGVGSAGAATVYVLVAMPLYFLAGLEPNGRDRPFVRDGLLVYGPALSLVVGLLVAVVAGHWYRSGRTWTEQTSDSPTTRR